VLTVNSTAACTDIARFEFRRARVRRCNFSSAVVMSVALSSADVEPLKLLLKAPSKGLVEKVFVQIFKQMHAGAEQRTVIQQSLEQAFTISGQYTHCCSSCIAYFLCFHNYQRLKNNCWHRDA
jgi:hypothetical protein